VSLTAFAVTRRAPAELSSSRTLGGCVGKRRVRLDASWNAPPDRERHSALAVQELLAIIIESHVPPASSITEGWG